MHFTSETTADGVSEKLFVLDDIHGALWTSAEATGSRPLVLIGHGGGQHKKAPGVLARAHRYVTACGFAAAAIDAPGHGDRSMTEAEEQRVAEIRQRMATGEQVGPLMDQLQTLNNGRVGGGEASAIGEAVGRHVDDAHDERPFSEREHTAARKRDCVRFAGKHVDRNDGPGCARARRPVRAEQARPLLLGNRLVERGNDSGPLFLARPRLVLLATIHVPWPHPTS